MPDQEMLCRDCGTAFLFTEAEQEFFRAQGFANSPKRCKECRAKQRHRGANARGSRRADVTPAAAPRADVAVLPPHVPHEATSTVVEPPRVEPPRAEPPAPRPPRPRGPMHTTMCSLCGISTEVPFVPDGVRPVFCLPCLKKQTR